MPLTAPTSDRLMRIDQARDLVFEGGRTGMQSGVTPWIAQSWQRCLDMGLQPAQAVGFDAVSAQHMRRVQEASRPLVQAAQPVLAELARAIADLDAYLRLRPEADDRFAVVEQLAHLRRDLPPRLY